MTAAHKFPMPTVSSRLTTSAEPEYSCQIHFMQVVWAAAGSHFLHKHPGTANARAMSLRLRDSKSKGKLRLTPQDY